MMYRFPSDLSCDGELIGAVYLTLVLSVEYVGLWIDTRPEVSILSTLSFVCAAIAAVTVARAFVFLRGVLLLRRRRLAAAPAATAGSSPPRPRVVVVVVVTAADDEVATCSRIAAMTAAEVRIVVVTTADRAFLELRRSDVRMCWCICNSCCCSPLRRDGR